jgi:L-fuculose-phosphate aldolase
VLSTAAEREAVALVCRRLHERGLIAGQDGNVSLRVGPDRVLVTPAGLCKVDVRPADLVELTLAGAPAAGSGAASSDTVGMHLRIYARRGRLRGGARAPAAAPLHVAGVAVRRARAARDYVADGRSHGATPRRTAALARHSSALAAPTRLMTNHGATTVGVDDGWRTADGRARARPHMLTHAPSHRRRGAPPTAQLRDSPPRTRAARDAQQRAMSRRTE